MWESFLRPKSYMGSVGVSLATAVGLAALEVPLAAMFFFVAFVSQDCSNGRTYKAGTCDTYTLSAVGIDALAGLMMVVGLMAGVALARVLLLVALGLFGRRHY